MACSAILVNYHAGDDPKSSYVFTGRETTPPLLAYKVTSDLYNDVLYIPTASQERSISMSGSTTGHFDQIRGLLNKNPAMTIPEAYSAVGIPQMTPAPELYDWFKDEIYLYKELNPKTGTYSFPKFEKMWVTEKACRILEQISEGTRETQIVGRVKLGDGVYVPNEAEQNCILKELAKEYSLGLREAYNTCECADIIPDFAPNALKAIEQKLSGAYTFFYAVKSVYNDYLIAKSQAVTEAETTEAGIKLLSDIVRKGYDAGFTLCACLKEADKQLRPEIKFTVDEIIFTLGDLYTTAFLAGEINRCFSGRIKDKKPAEAALSLTLILGIAFLGLILLMDKK